MPRVMKVVMEIVAHGLWAAAGAIAAKWWTPWFWAATYAALGVTYYLLWRKGWMIDERPSQKEARREAHPMSPGRKAGAR